MEVVDVESAPEVVAQKGPRVAHKTPGVARKTPVADRKVQPNEELP
jgi:hypothetical protein